MCAVSVPITRAAFSRDEKLVVTSGLDGVVHIWNKKTMAYVRSFPSDKTPKPCFATLRPKRMNIMGDLEAQVLNRTAACLSHTLGLTLGSCGACLLHPCTHTLPAAE